VVGEEIEDTLGELVGGPWVRSILVVDDT